MHFIGTLSPFLSAVYTGIAPGRGQDIGICIALFGMGLGFSVQFVLSERISAEANLYVLMTISVGAVYMFVMADSNFGTGRRRRERRSCWRRKHEERAPNGQLDGFHESNCKSMQ